MIVTTTPSVDGKMIRKYIGLVSGADLYSAGGLLGGGYTSKGQTLYYQSAVRIATEKMIADAGNADAIVGVSVSIGSSSVANQVIVTVTGTAVYLGRIDADINEMAADDISQARKFTIVDDCIGCGLCVSNCPEVFSLSDEGRFVAIDTFVPAEFLRKARLAKDDCPVGAIKEESAF